MQNMYEFYKNFYLYFFLFCPVFLITAENHISDFIYQEENIKINWTTGIIYSEFSSVNPEYTKEKVYEIAYQNLLKKLLEINFESGKTLKHYLNEKSLYELFSKMDMKINIEEQVEYLNKKSYLLSFDFMKHFDSSGSSYIIDDSEFAAVILKESPVDGVVIYVSKKEFNPSLKIVIYSSNGKLVYKSPVKKYTYYANDRLLYKNKINPPYIVYAQKIINKSDIVLDHKDIEFLLATGNIKQLEKLKIVIYDS